MKRYQGKGRLANELAGLPALDRPALVERWQELHHCAPPPNISRPLLLQAVAYALQAQVHGGLKPATARYLASIAASHAVGAPVALPARSIKAGTKLLREWHGKTYEVMILEKGVSYAGKPYRSLSEAARAITGTRWSGPRFFGLIS